MCDDCALIPTRVSLNAGVYLFFLFFALAMLLLQLLILLTNLYITGRVPRILLIARSHSVSPMTILRRATARWYARCG